jgi:hypothetical protein
VSTRIGIITLGGLNPVAAAEEAGIEAENMAMSSVIDYGQLGSFWELSKNIHQKLPRRHATYRLGPAG